MTFLPEAVEVNLYDALELPRTAQISPATSEEIKAAFRHAILRHHPDKAAVSSVGHSKGLWQSTSSAIPQQTGSSSAISVDMLLLARHVLLNPALRREYDRYLSLNSGAAQKRPGLHVSPSTNPAFKAPEFEIFDLDDMDHDADALTWTRPCRCGNASAYKLFEEDLIQASEHQGPDGEVFVGCDDCSLFAKVLFHVLDESGEQY